MSESTENTDPIIELPTVVAPPTGQAEVIKPAIAPGPVGIGMVVAIAIFVALITTSTVMVAYDYFLAQKIVTVDVKGYLLEQQGEFLAGKITEAQLKGAFDRLELAIQAVPKSKIIIMGDAVVRGVETINIDGSPRAKK